MRLLICAGGTGGGVYPAMTVLEALAKEAQPVLWVGGQGGLEADLVQRAGLPFTAIPAAGVHGVGPAALPGNLWKLMRGVFASRRILRAFRPEVILLTGGYVGVPMALAARRIPKLLIVPDIEPGWALKFMANRADRITLTAEESQRYFRRKAPVVVTGYPVRTSLLRAPSGGLWEHSSACACLNLNPERPVVLVFGGSKGAHSINQALFANLAQLLEFCQVVHVSGQVDWPQVAAVRAGLSPSQAENYHPFPYLHEELGAALASADLAISRAGAATLGEYPLFGLPAILVPYPYAWRYQFVNASYLAERGAALIVEDGELKSRLLPLVQELLIDRHTGRLRAMSQAMRSLSVPGAAERIAHLVRELTGSVEPSAQSDLVRKDVSDLRPGGRP